MLQHHVDSTHKHNKQPRSYNVKIINQLTEKSLERCGYVCVCACICACL